MAARSRSDAPKPRSDIYTGLLVLAFVAQMVGVAFLAIDYFSYPNGAPKPVTYNPPAATAQP